MRLGKGLGIINSLYENYLKQQKTAEAAKQIPYINGKIGSYEFVLDTLIANEAGSQIFVMLMRGDRNIFRYYPEMGMGILSDNLGSTRVLEPQEAVRELLIKAFNLTGDGKSIAEPILFDYET